VIVLYFFMYGSKMSPYAIGLRLYVLEVYEAEVGGYMLSSSLCVCEEPGTHSFGGKLRQLSGKCGCERRGDGAFSGSDWPLDVVMLQQHQIPNRDKWTAYQLESNSLQHHKSICTANISSNKDYYSV
jgi:hypothetical protein